MRTVQFGPVIHSGTIQIEARNVSAQVKERPKLIYWIAIVAVPELADGEFWRPSIQSASTPHPHAPPKNIWLPGARQAVLLIAERFAQQPSAGRVVVSP